MTEENLGAQFNLADYMTARKKTIEALHETARQIKPGQTEKEAELILMKELEKMHVEKFWHPTKLRMNLNTTKTFRAASEPAILTDDDIFFLDIGPVFLNHEGDYGETFVVGNNPKHLHLQKSSKEIFELCQREWKDKALTGQELYVFAESEANKRGLKLNTLMNGHRLGDFPHALHHRGDLIDFDKTPKANLWVLEIHVIDESINRGAFYEDILV